jgi:hypothetical protein
VLLLAACVGFLVYQETVGGDNQPKQAYYFDRNTEKLVVGSAEAQAPVETQSGPHEGEPAAVEVFVATCGECADSYKGMGPDELAKQDVQITLLAKTVKVQKNGGAERVRMVRRLDGSQWVEESGRSGGRLVRQQRPGCPNGVPAHRCYPGGRAH